MKFKFLFLALIISRLAFAQTHEYTQITKYDAPKSPNAGAIEKYLTVPANYQTGQVNPAIPLMSFSVDEFDVGINLSYSSTGLKLIDVATWVGLGWNLNCGGAVTRSVKGIPDDSGSGLLSTYWADKLDKFNNNLMTDPYEKLDYFKSISKQQVDSEHDLFYYDALGTKGTFYINRSTCIQFPQTNNKITFERMPNGGPIASFTVTNERGDKFFFTEKEETTIQNNTSQDVEQSSYYNFAQGSTWYLSRVQTKNGQDIWFTYEHYSYTKIDRSESQSFNISGTSCFPGSNTSGVTNRVTALVKLSQLKKISWKNGYIKFNAGTNRTDLIAFDSGATAIPSLGSVEMYRSAAPLSELNAVRVQNISFEYDQSPRLFLKKVNFKGNGTVVKHSYSFNYKSGTPAYPNSYTNSYNAQDYWGYYNGVANAGLIPFGIIDNSLYQMVGLSQMQSAQPNDRNPVFACAAAGMLEEIYYPTGGKTKFSYEGNMDYKNSYTASILRNTLPYTTNGQGDVLITLGGVRIRQLEFYSNPNAVNPSTVTNVKYEPAFFGVRQLPLFVSLLKSFSINGGNSQCDICNATELYTIHSSSLINDPRYQSEYKKVTEYSGATNNVGQTIHDYSPSYIGSSSSFDSSPYPIPQYLNYYAKEDKTLNQLPNATTVSEKSASYGTYGDLPPGQTNYDQDLKVSMIRNDNCIYQTNIDRLPVSQADATALSAGIFSFGSSRLISENYVTTGTIQKTYDPNGLVVTDQIDYIYNYTQKNRLLPNSSSQVNSKGETLKTLYAYPQDYFAGSPATTSDPAVNGLFNLIDKNVLNVPVEQLSILTKGGSNYVTGGTLVIFFSDKLAVSKVYKLAVSQPILLSSFTKSKIGTGGIFEYDSRYQLEKQFYSFNADNQPLEFGEKGNGLRHSLIWDYNSTYPIAEVVAAPPASGLNQVDIAYTSFEGDGTGNWVLSSPAKIANGLTGSKSYSLAYGAIFKNGLTAGTKYLVSYWTRGSAPLSITGTQSGYPVAGLTINGWTRYEHLVTGQTTITLSGTAIIDEVGLYPQGAQITTYAYDPLVGMTSIVDAKNKITYYTYDNFNRLQAVWDHNKNIIKSYCYNYQGTVVDCAAPVSPNTTPESPVPGVYVHWEPGSFSQTSYSNGAGLTVTTISMPMVAHFYSDVACTQPLSLAEPITIKLDYAHYTYNALTNTNTYSSGTYGTYSVPTGVTTYSIGSVTRHIDTTYYDEYNNFLDDTQDYFYTPVMVTGGNYVIIN